MPEPINAPTETKKKRGCGFWVLVAIGIIIALGVIGTIFGPTEEQKIEMAEKREQDKIEEAAKEREAAEGCRNSAVKVTAKELFRAYEANEMAAQQTYGDKLLEVTGIIDGVDLDISDTPIVKLRTDNQYMSASVYLTDATQSFASGTMAAMRYLKAMAKVTEID